MGIRKTAECLRTSYSSGASTSVNTSPAPPEAAAVKLSLEQVTNLFTEEQEQEEQEQVSLVHDNSSGAVHQESFAEALNNLCEHCTDQESSIANQTLSVIARRILDNRNDPMWRSIQKSNKPFIERVGRHGEAAERCMLLMGFRLEPSLSFGSQNSKFFFEPSESNWVTLEAAAATLIAQINQSALNSAAPAHSQQPQTKTKQGSPITSEADTKQLVHKAPSIELLDQGTAATQTAEVVSAAPAAGEASMDMDMGGEAGLNSQQNKVSSQ